MLAKHSNHEEESFVRIYDSKLSLQHKILFIIDPVEKLIHNKPLFQSKTFALSMSWGLREKYC